MRPGSGRRATPDRRSGVAALLQDPGHRSRVVDAVLREGFLHELLLDLAAFGQGSQRLYDDRLGVDLEEAPGCGAGVGEAEAVRTERVELARHPLGDLVG